jgi:hypothetical protein
MPDNVTLNEGVGGASVRTVAKTANLGAQTQAILLDIGGGADSSPESIVSSGNPLPVAGTVTANVVGGNSVAVKVDGSAVTQPVSGTFWQATQPVSLASSPLPTGAATDSNLTTIAGDAITGATIPTGGTGNVGWLSAIWTKLGNLLSSDGAAGPYSGHTIALWNGATYDRAPGSAALGQKVQINSASSVGDTLTTGGATGSVVIATAGGSSTHSYVPGDTATLTGGTFTTATVLTVATTGVTSATVAAGGTGGTNGTQTVTGTTGTGTKFTALVTVAGNAITAVLSITLAGAYTVNPTTLTAEPVTGASLTGATLNLNMGIVSATITTPGVYTVAPTNPVAQGSSSGAGTGATFTLTYAPIAQTLFSSAIPVNGWKINNPSNVGNGYATDNGVTPTTSGPSSYTVFAGGYQFATEPGEKPSGSAVQYLGPAIGAPIIARRW